MDELGVAEEEARAALARVLASEGFRVAPRLTAFLRFVVDRTLAGDAASLKGYTIATGALGRTADFDPQVDPIVRVEAGRLRRALEAYYAGPGRDDPVMLAVPRGRYVPQFRRVAAVPREIPSVAVSRRRVSPNARAAIAAAAGFLLGVLVTIAIPPGEMANGLAASWQAEARAAP
jgi:hypothetical protein